MLRAIAGGGGSSSCHDNPGPFLFATGMVVAMLQRLRTETIGNVTNDQDGFVSVEPMRKFDPRHQRQFLEKSTETSAGKKKQLPSA